MTAGGAIGFRSRARDDDRSARGGILRSAESIAEEHRLVRGHVLHPHLTPRYSARPEFRREFTEFSPQADEAIHNTVERDAKMQRADLKSGDIARKNLRFGKSFKEIRRLDEENAVVERWAGQLDERRQAAKREPQAP